MILWEHFDRNEWYIMAMLILTYGAVLLLPKRVEAKWRILALVWGFASSTFFDFTIGGGLIDFYVVNDSDRYELTDLLVYILFATFAYFFIYFYEVLKIGKKTLVYYIVGWTIVAFAMQWVSEWMRLTDYQRGYKMEYNIVVFLVIQTITGLYYNRFRSDRSRRYDGAPYGQ
ncbi:hypothetical protein D3P08_00415 [Paenibacillus nanensis]|uniref:Uncharacterized protein n=1 Tax=Paenibacillus nanensis TaxID=393251 RepID=A0A3A1VI20_9BACL|nr:hypothetical protein [Paenibacillus nanensis]RIX60091.1 hypothetical protein D3P08_00415 [Paenibacillus nanensis]